MTDRIKGFVVTLDRDIREDDAEATINALKMVKGVIAVERVRDTPGIAIETTRLRAEMAEKIWELYKDTAGWSNSTSS